MKGSLTAVWIVVAALGVAVLLLWREVARQDREFRERFSALNFSLDYSAEDRLANVIREQKRQSDLAMVRYFPERSFDGDLIRDTILADVYSRPLRSLAFPPFATWVSQQRRGNSLWLNPQFRLIRSMQDGVSLLAHVFVERTPPFERGRPNVGDDNLVVRTYDPRIDFNQNMVAPSVLLRLRPEKRARFEELIEEMKFWEMPGAAGSGGNRLMLEGVDGDRYHVVVREGDSSKELVELFGIIEEVAERELKSRRPAQRGMR
jgi:hypothetical protein